LLNLLYVVLYMFVVGIGGALLRSIKNSDDDSNL